MNLDTTNTTLIPPVPTASLRRPLLTPLAEPGHFLLVLDNSSAEKFVTCPQSAYNYLVLGREAHARNAALTFGGAAHAGLEVFLKWQYDAQIAGCNEPPHGPEPQNAAIVRHFQTNPTPPDEYRTLPNALTILEEFRHRSKLPDYDWTILSDDKGPLIERAFELPLGVVEVGAFILMPWWNDRQSRRDSNQEFQCAEGGELLNAPVFVSHIHIAWSGRMDLIANWNGMNRVIDHKTTAIAGDQVIQDFQLSNQALGYVWAAKQLWPELSVRGFAVNFLHFKKPTGSGPITAPGPRGGPPALSIFPAFFDYTDERLAWWEENAIAVVSDFIHCLVRNQFPSHTKWCFGKYGKCPYHDVCSQDSAELRRKLIMSDLYRPVTWNPTADRI